MENFLEKRRPPEEIRDKLDISYKIIDQSIFIFEIRPRWNKPEEQMHIEIAKATYVKNKDIWKVYWKRADLKWHPYDPPTVKTLHEFTETVNNDEYGCFWG
nr:DUF3024 domain-containing protein [Marivirga aurantiaca]